MFSRILVANRGEIACRIIRTCRRLGIQTVAVYSDADVDALHVKLADEAIGIGPAPSAQSYLNHAALLGALQKTKADALHPGYGFLSENGTFAAEVAQVGVCFIGPSPEALEFLSDKVRARERAAAVGLPPVPGVHLSPDDDPVKVNQLAMTLGSPLLVKAAAGGGGIGMHRVNDLSGLAAALETARNGAARSFGDGRVYLERYLERPHHVELQVLRTAAGQFAALGTRECSIQRRFQKIIEECPSPTFQGLPPETQARVELFAQRLLESVDYIGVATLELLVDDDAHVYFLEVNARLQVEHTVTEAVFGLDLVEAQLRIAARDDIRPLLEDTRSRGHAIEARICAESPAKGFIPQPGQVQSFECPEVEGVRVDSGIVAGSQLPAYYDSLAAKVIAWAPDRALATQRLLGALGSTRLVVVGKQGLRDNNCQLLQDILQTEEWRLAHYDTHTVERVLAAKA